MGMEGGGGQRYLEGSQAELDAQPQAHVEVVRQEVEDHVMRSKKRDEQQGGLSQSPAMEGVRRGRERTSQGNERKE